MAIFQKSVIKKHLNNLDKEHLDKAYRIFKENYSPSKIEKIKQLKEEEYQDGFLRDLFVDIFGYILKPDANYNLVREFKNQADGRKADGAIIDNNGVAPLALAVIELKSTKTKDFKNVTEQAFGYKNNQPECKYVIISNFQKLRFYIDYANEYEEFDLFHLNKEEFELLYLILKKESIFSNLPLKLKEETKFHEQEVSDKLYKDYSRFKKKLFENLVKNHPESNRLTLFKKSQKLLDRFLFVLFAEDSGLLPPNSIPRIVKRFEVLKEEDAYKPIYEIFKQYFEYMNVGRKGKSSSDDIPAYNGGLFYPDELLDSLKIYDEILIDDLLRLSEYDFNTEVDVNILGHIFEHSLSEIEEITAGIEGAATDKTKSKRKKDGVFYTPKYITQYIVENTIGTLCNEKRKELEIEEIEFDGTYKKKDGTLSAKGKTLFQKLQDYKDWLLSLKIVDPACGSGAFLNQALNFLIQEHKNIDDIIAELTNTALRLFDTDKAILENNLYGVDINEESVEIAKLSLWLRTAQKGRKLSVLSNNIKCGNSLIDNPEVAGEKAFDWKVEFPQIFTKKKKKTWHITTATHNSRYSQRMFDNHVDPGEAVWLSEQDEIIIAEIIADIVNKDKLSILEYNICGDHMHILLVCDENELPKIVGKIKAMTARACNIATGRTIPATTTTRGHVPLSGSDSEAGSDSSTNTKNEKKYNSLWTQKFGKRKITGDKDLQNVINYIRTNRQKHELPENIKLEKIIGEMSCSVDHAFRTEYTGGFDVVIGNPPYVSKTFSDEMKEYIKSNYETAEYQLDLYVSFMEKAAIIAKKGGIISYIVPNSWLKNLMFSQCRYYLASNLSFEVIIPNLENIFTDASVDTLIFIARCTKNIENEIIIGEFLDSSFSLKHKIPQNRFLQNEKFIFDVEINANSEGIFKKIDDVSVKFDSICDITRGINPYDKYRGQSEEIIKNKRYHADYKKDETFVPEIRGKHVNRYLYEWDYLSYVSYGDWLAAPREIKYFTGERIICRQVLSTHLNCCVISEDFIIDQSVFIGKLNEVNKERYLAKYILCLFASKLLSFYFRYKANEFDALFPKIKIGEFKSLPVKPIKIEGQRIFAEHAEKLEMFFKQQITLKNKFLKYLQSQFSIETFSKKLQNWYELEFGDFIKEVNKVIKNVGGEKLTKMNEMEWMEVFETKKAEAQALKTEIDTTDKQIDQMVYELYGLTEEEIGIVENSVK